MSGGSAVFLVLLSIVCIGLLLTPFYPAWSEWRNPTDDTALGVAASQTSDAMYLASAFRNKITARMTDEQPSGYLAVAAMNRDSAQDQKDKGAEGGGLAVIAPNSMRSLNYVQCKQPLYAKANLDLQGGGVLSEVLSLGYLHLGPKSRVSGWAHSDKGLVLGEDSVAVRRLSSAQGIDLAQGCHFERIHAPVVRFGHTPLRQIERKVLAPDVLMSMSEIPQATRWGEHGWRIQGDCHIPAGRHLTGSLVVTGTLTIGRGAVIEGDIKARKGISIGTNAAVTGAITCEGDIHVLRHAVVGGPIVSETHMLLCSGAHIGSQDKPTTVSADAIMVEGGVVAHGTVWARQAGIVWGEA